MNIIYLYVVRVIKQGKGTKEERKANMKFLPRFFRVFMRLRDHKDKNLHFYPCAVK